MLFYVHWLNWIELKCFKYCFCFREETQTVVPDHYILYCTVLEKFVITICNKLWLTRKYSESLIKTQALELKLSIIQILLIFTGAISSTNSFTSIIKYISQVKDNKIIAMIYLKIFRTSVDELSVIVFSFTYPCHS